MSIVKTHRKKRNFSTLNNSAPNDEKLSYRAKGILWYLLTKPADWTVRMSDIVNRSPKEGRDAISSAFKELETHGYAIRRKCKNDKGQFLWETNIFETKEDAAEWKETHNGLSVHGQPETHNGLSVNGSPVNGFSGHIVNTEKLNTEKLNTDQERKKQDAHEIPGVEEPSSGMAEGHPCASHTGKGNSKSKKEPVSIGASEIQEPSPTVSARKASFADHPESGRRSDAQKVEDRFKETYSCPWVGNIEFEQYMHNEWFPSAYKGKEPQPFAAVYGRLIKFAKHDRSPEQYNDVKRWFGQFQLAKKTEANQPAATLRHVTLTPRMKKHGFFQAKCGQEFLSKLEAAGKDCEVTGYHDVQGCLIVRKDGKTYWVYDRLEGLKVKKAS